MAIYKLRENIKLNNNFKKDSSIDYLELSGIDNFDTRHLTIDELPSRAKWIIDKNTIIIGRVRPLNKNHNKYMKDSILIGSSGFTCFKSTDVNVLNDYLWYVLQKENFTNYTSDHAKGSAYPEISQSDLLNFKFYAPKISEQQKIIDIIKPIELSINCLKLQKENIEKILEKLPINTTDKYIIFDSIKTGRRNANHENNDGKYNFYTCGEKIRKCEEFSFNGRYILLSGNANLYSWWYNGKFDLYQRVYALSPSSDFFTSYHSVKKEMQKLRNESSGSVIKYIKIGDIEHIKKLNNNFEKILETLYNALSKTDSLIELMENLRKNQLELLIK